MHGRSLGRLMDARPLLVILALGLAGCAQELTAPAAGSAAQVVVPPVAPSLDAPTPLPQPTVVFGACDARAVWKTDLPWGDEEFPTLISTYRAHDATTVYVLAVGVTNGSRVLVHAIAREDGALRWSRAIEGVRPGTAFPPFLTDGSAVVVQTSLPGSSGEAGPLVVLDAATGDELWRRSERWQDPLVASGHVVLEGLRWVTGHDARTGAERWNVTIPERRSLSELVAGDGRLLMTTYSHDGADRLAAIDPGTGATLWSREVEGTSLEPYHAGRPYVVTRGAIAAFDPVTGERRWVATGTTGDNSVGRFAADDDTFYWSTRDGDVRALDAQTGDVRWRLDAGASTSYEVWGTRYTRSAPEIALAEARVLVMRINATNHEPNILGAPPDTAIWSLDPATGATAWEIAGSESTRIVRADDPVLLARSAGLDAYRGADGAPVWQCTVADGADARFGEWEPFVVGDELYVHAERSLLRIDAR